MNFIKHILTGKDNQTWDMGKVSWATCIVAVIAAAAANWWHGSVIPLIDFGGALTGVCLGHGAALGLKKSTEPGQ
jgi:hypothetical protein